MAVELNHTIVPAHDPQASAQFLADILGLPVDPPVAHFTPVTLANGVSPVSYVRDGDVLLTPGGGRWTLNLAGGRPARIRLRGRDAPARPELVTDRAELERLLGVIAEKNPRAARFIPIPRRPDGRLDPDALDAALQHGIVRWHLAEQG